MSLGGAESPVQASLVAVSAAESPIVFRLLPNGKVGVADWDSGSRQHLTWAHLDGWNPIAVQGFLYRQEHIELDLAETLSTYRPTLRFDHKTGRAAAVLPTLQEDTDAAAAPILLICHENMFITATQEPSPFVRGLMEEWLDDPEGIGMNPPCLLKSFIHALANGDTDQVDQIHERIESLEDSIYEMKTFDASSAICIKREILEQRRRLTQIRDFVFAVTRHGEPWAGQAMAADYQDISAQVLRQIESLDLGRDILSSVMDAQLGIISNRLNEVMRVLTVVSTLMMAASLIAGIYGMNFTHLPGSQSETGFYLCLAVMVLVSAVILAVFKRQKFL